MVIAEKRWFLPLVAVVWYLLYQALIPASEALVAALPVERDSHLGSALQFFFYDTPKVLLLLTGIVFVMGIIHTFVSPERTRAMLSGKHLGVGNVMAATLGIAILAGLLIGKLGMEHYLEDWVRAMQNTRTADVPGGRMTWTDRINHGFQHVREIVGKVWPYIIAGVGVGALIHGYVPQDFMASFMGKDVWWAVPAAVILGVPMYTNAAGVIPIVQALLAKGAALGTVLAFMMSVIALSAPEMIILRKVLKPRLIATFAGIVALGILLVGYVFNLVL